MKPESPKPKHLSQRIHAKKRALQRYGVQLTTAQIFDLIDQIKSRDAILVAKQTLRVKVYLVTHGDRYMVAVYDRKRKEIITFLPHDSVEWVDTDASNHAKVD